MRRNNKSNIRRERIIMIASSAFVMTALTMTGVYMKEKSAQSQNDGYTIDFTALDNNADDKYREIADNSYADLEGEFNAVLDGIGTVDGQINMEDDLDYMPMEAGSHLVEIPGLTDGSTTLSEESTPSDEDGEDPEALKHAASDDAEGKPDEEEAADKLADEAVSGHDVVVKELHFPQEAGLVRPTAGEVLLPYSMDASIYFATLDQYKYNSAVIFTAEEGSSAIACAEGKVIDIYEDAQIGKAVTLDLGDGYQATYGQLPGYSVKRDGYVNPGEVIGSVAAPTKYYSVEGNNLYFNLTKDGTPVNPETMFKK